MMIDDHVIIDDFIPDPLGYLKDCLSQEFRTFDFPECSFHGICNKPLDSIVPELLKSYSGYPGLSPTLSFLRRSPEGQVEPHYIHTDIDMGKWSAILYLNPEPIIGDGTEFWIHDASGSNGDLIPHSRSMEGMTKEGWTSRIRVQAKFNRMLLFPSSYFHSRALFNNYGVGADSRLTQVTFGEYI